MTRVQTHFTNGGRRQQRMEQWPRRRQWQRPGRQQWQRPGWRARLAAWLAGTTLTAAAVAAAPRGGQQRVDAGAAVVGSHVYLVRHLFIPDTIFHEEDAYGGKVAIRSFSPPEMSGTVLLCSTLQRARAALRGLLGVHILGPTDSAGRGG